MIGWFVFCLLLVIALCVLVIWPLLQHPTLPRHRKWLLSIVIFLLLVPGGMALYSWVGMPPMALL